MLHFPNIDSLQLHYSILLQNKLTKLPFFLYHVNTVLLVVTLQAFRQVRLCESLMLAMPAPPLLL